MMIQAIGRAMILVTMIRPTTMMIMGRISDDSLLFVLKLCLTLWKLKDLQYGFE